MRGLGVEPAERPQQAGVEPAERPKGAGFTLVQLSDTHLRAEGELVHGSVDTFANLTCVLDMLAASGQRIDAMIFSGDVADDGDPAAYRRLRGAVDPVAESLGAATIYAMGNHDERAAFGRELLDDPRASDPDRTFDSVQVVDGVRIVVLDSSTPGRHDGRIDPHQLLWLAEVLAVPSLRGTILVLHHPPISSPVVTVDYLRLQNPADLECAIAGSDVRVIVCGHAHHTAAGSVGGVPVWVGPAMSYRVDTFPPAGRHRGLSGFGFTRIDLLESGFTATAVEVAPAATVYDESRQSVLDKLAHLSHQAG
ncbi:metallophosphatase [Rhodococcoides fascians A21d2]|uniref:metallophosphoesterase n=1 Tax=Rhodococcus sp. WWJCD1 TaxID=2022519 RepID=UPI0009B8531C|nr:metallophosphoesterase [Rhodococcus sp. WWJCD1]OZC47902.1 metallophosphatase [Rhodococcus sp. WWJCD1]QII02850.1 metallophosphatase [Rhodococcus fascians A21d2]